MRGGDVDVAWEALPACGGRLHRLEFFGVDVLRTPPDRDTHEREPFFWGCFPMVPWCNRVPGGRLVFGDVDVTLPLTMGSSAIHGEAYARPWLVEAADLVFHGGDFGFPWRYTARQHFETAPAAFRMTLSVTNDDDRAMPAGVGVHPWYRADRPLRLRVPAGAVYDIDAGVAVGPPHPVASDTDLRKMGPPPWGADTVFTALSEHAVELHWPDDGLALTVRFSAAADHVVVAAFHDFGAVAIEPQTQASDGFGRLARGEPGGASVVEPGGSLSVTYDFAATAI